MPDKRLIALTC